MKRIKTMHAAIAVALTLLIAGCGKVTPDSIKTWKQEGDTGKLISALNAPEQYLKLDAIAALQALKATEAEPALAALFDHPDRLIARNAMLAVAEIRGPNLEQNMIKAMAFEDPETRAIMTETLGSLNAPSAADALLAALDDPSEQVVAAAAAALAGTGDQRAIEPLSHLTEHLSFDIRFNSLQTIHTLGGAETTPLMKDALDDLNPEIRTLAVEAILDDEAAAYEYGHIAIRDDNKRVRASGIAIIDGMGGADNIADEVWLAMAQVSLGNETEADRALAAELAAKGEAAITPLLETAAHPNPAVNRTAFWALEGIGEAAAEPAVDAVAENASADAVAWFEARANWPGAPDWRLDLWAATIALDPEFDLPKKYAHYLANRNAEARAAMKSSVFKPTREMVPLLIHQLALNEKDGQAVLTLFGIPLSLGEADGASKSGKGENIKLAMKHLTALGEVAAPPLIAAVGGEDPVTASASVKVLGDLGDTRAVPAIRQGLETQLATTEDLGTSTFYLALLDMDAENSMDLLQRVRPSEDYVRHLFAATYPGVDVQRIKSPDYKAKAPNPVNYKVGYLKEGRVQELPIRFTRTEERVWEPDEPLPETLP